MAEEVSILSGGGAIALQKLMGRWVAMLALGRSKNHLGARSEDHVLHSESREVTTGPTEVQTAYVDCLCAIGGGSPFQWTCAYLSFVCVLELTVLQHCLARSNSACADSQL